jgi:S-layer homology domain
VARPANFAAREGWVYAHAIVKTQRSTRWGRPLLSAVAVVVLAIGGGLASAFFDEVLALKAELAQWEAVHAEADFSDILEQLDTISGTVFSDVVDGSWYATYVTSLAEWGIVSGYRDKSGALTGEFGPANPVTVAEILKMATEAARADLSTCLEPVNRSDARDHWSSAYVGCAQRNGARVLEASYGATLDRPATRAEVLAILHDLFGDNVPPVAATFADAAGHRFGSDIAYASLLEVVSGDTDAAGQPSGTFRPDDAINRAEAAKILYLRIKRQARQDIALSS